MRTLLQINTVINSGSTGRIAEGIGNLAIKNDWQSIIAYGRNVLDSSSKSIKIGNDWDIRWHGLITRLGDRHGLGSKKATEIFINQVVEIKPDIIHLHNIHGYFINIEVLFKFLEKAGVPVVWTLHDCWPITGHCAYFDFVECNKWKSYCSNCPQITSYPSSYFLDRSKKNFHLKKDLFTSVPDLVLVPVSYWLGNILKDSFFKQTKIKVIHNGINLEEFQPRCKNSIVEKWKLSNKTVILGVASIWSPRKGLQDFIHLSSMLDERFQLVLVGLSSSQLSSLPNNIIGIERTENISQLCELYTMSDIFLNLTYEDNFPTTNLEAMACGTPVITYRTGGSPESINKNTGIVVEKGDLDGILSAIFDISNNGRSFYSNSCIDHVKKSFNKDERFSEYIQLYKTLLNQR